MNNCILMAEIIQEPQLRYTSDNQMPIAEMTVQFEGLRDDDPPSKLKVIAWGGLAQDVQETYHVGDRIIIEGRVNINTFDRPEGFKEKRAELTAQRIYRLSNDATVTVSSADNSPTESSRPASKSAPAPRSSASASKSPAYSAPTTEPPDYDEIPF